jgi:hypothetical protein
MSLEARNNRPQECYRDQLKPILTKSFMPNRHRSSKYTMMFISYKLMLKIAEAWTLALFMWTSFSLTHDFWNIRRTSTGIASVHTITVRIQLGAATKPGWTNRTET